MVTPQWNARHNGLLGDASAMANAADVNQLLGTHAQAEIHVGSLGANDGSPDGGSEGGTNWFYQFSTQDIDQPFQPVETTLSRVMIPLLCVGNGADLLVSLCTDSSGSPASMITQTRIPASWIYQLSAVASVSVPSTEDPVFEYTNSPLAVAQFNTFHMNTPTVTNWSYPSPTSGGPVASATSTAFNGYFIQLGGGTGSTYYSAVYSIPFDDTGVLSQAIPQPSLPTATQGTGGAVVSTDSSGNNTLVFLGGAVSGGSPYTSAVYTAGFDDTTGTVAAWTQQTSLPAAIGGMAMATYNGYVYVVGGGSNSGTSINTVYYAQVVNGQITAWATSAVLPVALAGSYAVAINGLLFVFGGSTSGPGGAESGAGSQNSFYAAINSNGSLGPWLPGPNIYADVAQAYCNAIPSVSPYGIIINGGEGGGGVLLQLGVTDNGPDYDVHNPSIDVDLSTVYYATTAPDVGTVLQYGLSTTGQYYTLECALTPRISVPLPVTGLSTSTTYHILMQQQGGDASNYLRTHLDAGLFDIFPALTSPRNAYTWTTGSSGTQVPLTFYDNTLATAGISQSARLPWHTWDDNGARISTLVYATTPDMRLLGICEATVMVTAANENTGAANTLIPWVATGGTLARSQAEVFEGLWAFQLTPDGVSSNSYMQSEFLNCLPGQSITISGWVWCTAAVTSNFSLSINWYTNGSVLINTSSNVVSIPGATWTFVTNTFTATTSGGGAYRYTLNPTLSGTQAASNVTYFDLVIGYPTYTGEQLSGVAQVVYPGTVWPEVNPLKPTGTVVLA